MVKRLDDDLGVLLNELEELGIAENTMIVFSSDNGHELYYSFKDRVSKPYMNMITNTPYNNVTDKFYSENRLVMFLMDNKVRQALNGVIGMVV